jgi:hypothetical protein
MEAICKADFESRVKVHKGAEAALNKAKKGKISTSGIIVSEVGFYDIYGVWFFGRLIEIIQHVGTERFGVDLGKQMQIDGQHAMQSIVIVETIFTSHWSDAVIQIRGIQLNQIIKNYLIRLYHCFFVRHSTAIRHHQPQEHNIQLCIPDNP